MTAVADPPTAEPSARRAAATTLDRIVRTGAYSNVLVARTTVEPASDHGFYQRLVFSALRHLPGIDRAIADAADRRIDDIDPPVLSALRIGTTELLLLRTEPHAAVNETVDALEGKAQRARGFVNAVLRRIADGAPPLTVDGRTRLEDAYPHEVVDRSLADLGRDEGVGFLEAANLPAPIGLRFRPGADEQGFRYADEGDDVDELSRRGLADIVDPASAIVASALDVRPGDRVIDLAAAPGGKARALADALDDTGLLVAADSHGARLRRAISRSADLPAIRWVRASAVAPPFRPSSWSRVLLDAPCTGLGTLRRRPEIRYRFDEAAPGRYGALQRAMVERALVLLAPGGRLVYSVCTPTLAETVEVVAGFGFRPPTGVEGLRHGDGVLLGPSTTGTDGMFIAVHDA